MSVLLRRHEGRPGTIHVCDIYRHIVRQSGKSNELGLVAMSFGPTSAII